MSKLSPYSKNQYDPNSQNTTWYKMVHMVPEGSTVLDIGCSTGTLGDVLKTERQASVVGIDITPNDVKVAATRLDKALVFNVEDQSFSDSKIMQQKYDVIIFADVLEHMKDPVAVLKKIKPLLSKNGRVIFSIPNMAHLHVRLQLLAGNFGYTETGLLDYTHLHFYDGNEVARIFADSAFNIMQYDCTTFAYPKELVVEKLQNLGLQAADSFFDIANSKQAVIFEYVGWAQPTANTKLNRRASVSSSSPLDEVLGYVQRVKDAHKSELHSASQKLSLTEAHVQKLEDTLELMRNDRDLAVAELHRQRSHSLAAMPKKIATKLRNKKH